MNLISHPIERIKDYYVRFIILMLPLFCPSVKMDGILLLGVTQAMQDVGIIILKDFARDFPTIYSWMKEDCRIIVIVQGDPQKMSSYFNRAIVLKVGEDIEKTRKYLALLICLRRNLRLVDRKLNLNSAKIYSKKQLKELAETARYFQDA